MNFNINIWDKWKCISLCLYFMIRYNTFLIQWELIYKQKTSTRVNQKKIKNLQNEYVMWERALDFNQWKTFFEDYKPMRIWLWLVLKFTENNCGLQLFSEFFQTQKRYPTSLDKISILTWKLLAISSQSFSFE